MFRKFDSNKAIQSIGVILRCHPHECASKLRVLKMLYIADRESIQEAGFPMFGWRSVAMDHGPLHSAAKDLIDGKHIDEPLLHAHVVREQYMLRLVKDPGVGELSRYEIEKLEEICERLAAKGDWEIAHGVTHQFPEWEENYQENTSKVISLEDIIDAVGRSQDKEAILSDLRDEHNANAAFGVG